MATIQSGSLKCMSLSRPYPKMAGGSPTYLPQSVKASLEQWARTSSFFLPTPKHMVTGTLLAFKRIFRRIPLASLVKAISFFSS